MSLFGALPDDYTLGQVCRAVRNTLDHEPEIRRLHIYRRDGWFVLESGPEAADRPFWVGSIGRVMVEPED